MKRLTSKLRNKERKPYTDRRNEVTNMFLRSQHENGEDELSGEQHLDDDALRNRCRIRECSADVQLAGEQCLDYERGDDGSHKLSDKQQYASNDADRADQDHPERYLDSLSNERRRVRGSTYTHRGIEQASADSKVDPGINGKRETERQRRIQQLAGRRLVCRGDDCVASVWIRRHRGRLRARKREE